jgi:hypothetical protein
MEEERRNCFVAITSTKERLVLGRRKKLQGMAERIIRVSGRDWTRGSDQKISSWLIQLTRLVPVSLQGSTNILDDSLTQHLK